MAAAGDLYVHPFQKGKQFVRIQSVTARIGLPCVKVQIVMGEKNNAVSFQIRLRQLLFQPEHRLL